MPRYVIVATRVAIVPTVSIATKVAIATTVNVATTAIIVTGYNDTESESHSNPSSGQLPRKAQAMAHLQIQPNLVLSNNFVEVTET